MGHRQCCVCGLVLGEAPGFEGVSHGYCEIHFAEAMAEATAPGAAVTTLDQAIAGRLEQQRQARERQVEVARQREETILIHEQVVAAEARRLIEAEYGFSLDGIELRAKMHTDEQYSLDLCLPGPYGMNTVHCSRPFGLNLETLDVWLYDGFARVTWVAFHLLNTSRDYDTRRFQGDLLDALVFARLGEAVAGLINLTIATLP